MRCFSPLGKTHKSYQVALTQYYNRSYRFEATFTNLSLIDYELGITL